MKIFDWSRNTYGCVILFLLAFCCTCDAKNFALLIGNSKYQHCSELSNPANDVALISRSLKKGGYDVSSIQDAKLADMTKALSRFCEKAKSAERVIVFYAGHGIEVDGKNYLVPVDAKLEKKGDQKWEALSLDKLLSELGAANIRVKMVVLDCCRDDPFGASRSWRKKRSILDKGGMAAVDADQLSRGSIIVYSGKPGETVPDGPKGGNSPFATAWNKELARAAGKSIIYVFTDMGDFLPASNKHWVKIDSDGESLAILNRTQFMASSGTKVAGHTGSGNNSGANNGINPPPPPKVLVVPVPPEFKHHRRDKHISFYTGSYEGNDAYYALSWQSENKFTGYCFLHEGSTIYYLDGNQPGDGKMQMAIWSNGREVRNAWLNKDKESGAIAWKGKSNIGKLGFSRKKVDRKPSKSVSKYRGTMGVDGVTAELKWSSNVDVGGRIDLNNGTSYAVVADNTISGTIYANLYSELGHAGVVILKKSTYQGLSWSGQCHMNNGKKLMLTIKK